MRKPAASGVFVLLLALPAFAAAQAVVEDRRAVGRATPEAWAMRTLAATTLMTSFGDAPGPGQALLSADLGHIPRLDEAQRQVGLGGVKAENLNKSPAFGRVRGAIGLPGRFFAELGWTPPVEIDGAKPRHLFAFALGARVLERDRVTLALRALAQVGDVRGDITCPASLAGLDDPVANPYRCRERSRDTFKTDHAGLNATLTGGGGPWRWHATAGLVRTDLAVQVDALAGNVRERAHLSSKSSMGWIAGGVRYRIAPAWSVAAEVLHVPLSVVRPPSESKDRDSMTSVRVQLRHDGWK